MSGEMYGGVFGCLRKESLSRTNACLRNIGLLKRLLKPLSVDNRSVKYHATTVVLRR